MVRATRKRSIENCMMRDKNMPLARLACLWKRSIGGDVPPFRIGSSAADAAGHSAPARTIETNSSNLPPALRAIRAVRVKVIS